MSRYSAPDMGMVDNAVLMVLRVDPDWMGASCRLELGMLPSWDGVFP
jgi:hypothetical protein